jgi:hypothetical protein
MPIRGLTDSNAQTFGAGFPRIATLYKGDEKPEEGNRPGKDLYHFRIEFEPEFEYLREDWYEMYTETPEEFPAVFLAQSEVDEAFSTWKEEWNASQTLLRRCDGEHQKVHYDQKTGIHNTWKADCLTPIPPTPPAEPMCKCKLVGRLNLIFPEFIELTGVLGYVTMATHSIHDLMTLHRYLTDLFKIQGNLMGIPLVFGRAIREISTPVTDNKTGKRTGARRKVKKSLLYLRATADYTKQVLLPTLATARTEAPALPQPVKEISLLTSGSDQPRRVGLIVNREPETIIEVKKAHPEPEYDIYNIAIDHSLPEPEFQEEMVRVITEYLAPEAEATSVEPADETPADNPTAFFSEVKKLGYTPPQALIKLGVKELGDWTGTWAEAIEKVKENPLKRTGTGS